MKTLFLSFICLLLIVSNILAQTTWRLATTGKDVEVYYDRGGISRKATGTIKVWTKYAYKKESAYIKYSVSLEEYQCNERMSRTLSETDYGQSGEVINTTTVRNLRWDYVTPDTVGESLYGIICEGRKDLQLKLDEVAEIERAKLEITQFLKFRFKSERLSINKKR